jgi:hypothetical protein
MNANCSGGSLAKGLRDDYEAVKAGMTLPWSRQDKSETLGLGEIP